MSNLLVAVKSCHRDRKIGFHDAIRGTWGKELGPNVVLRFFMGQNPDQREGTQLRSDEVLLNCPDDYMSLPHKTRQIGKWMTDRMFENVFLCDNDSIVQPKKLLALPYQRLDYGGYFKQAEADLNQQFYYEDHVGKYPECYPWASGGMGYFLSKNAAWEVAERYPLVWAEDMYVGQVIGPVVKNGEFTIGKLDMGSAVWHFRKSSKFSLFTPELLYRIYNENGPAKIYAEASANQ